MPQRFKQTEDAIEKGLTEIKPKAGAKLVADWIGELDKADVPGVKGIHNDLDRLHKELEKEDADQEKIKKILGKLGPATVKIADRIEDEKVADKVRVLGQALVDHGIEGGEDEAEDEEA